MTLFEGLVVGLLFLSLGLWMGWTFWGREGQWVNAVTHDVSLMPGGQVLHHSTCWCKADERQDTDEQPDAAEPL